MKISKEIKEQLLTDKDHLSLKELSNKYHLQRSKIKNIIEAAGKKTPKWFYIVSVSKQN